MSGWGKYAFAFIVAAFVVGIGFYVMRPQPLATHGGVRIVLQVAPKNPADWPQDGVARIEKMRAAQNAILNRLRGADTAEPTVVIVGDDKILIQAPGVRNAQDFARTLTTTAALEFYYLKDIQNSNNPMGKWRMEPAMGQNKGYIFTDPHGLTIDSLKQPAEVLAKVVDATRNKPVLTGQDLLPNVRANLNARNQTVINIEFNREGTDIFRRFTRAHVGDYLAVFFDGKLITAPSITDAIPGGKAEITGFKSIAEAKQAADYLNAGALPVPLKVISAESVQPSR